MTSLALLTSEYRQVAQRLSEMDFDEDTITDTLDSMAGELEAKAQNVGMMVRHLEADAAAIKQWAKDATERAKAIESRAERLREYLAWNLARAGIQRVSGPGIELTFRKSSAVVIDEPGLLPATFMRHPEPPPPAPDKRAIGDAIKAGQQVPGAHIEHRQSLQIK